jgi:hypothetical protein
MATSVGVGVIDIPGSRTHCVNGHEWTDENIYRGKDQERLCRTCRRLQKLRRREAAYDGQGSLPLAAGGDSHGH